MRDLFEQVLSISQFKFEEFVLWFLHDYQKLDEDQSNWLTLWKQIITTAAMMLKLSIITPH